MLVKPLLLAQASLARLPSSSENGPFNTWHPAQYWRGSWIIQPITLKEKTMKIEQLLLLKQDSFRKETNDLFEELASNPVAKKLFIENPAGVMRTKLSFIKSDSEFPRDDSDANRLLFSIISNPKFFNFIQQQQDKINKKLNSLFLTPATKPIPDVIDREAILQEFAAAFIKFGDKEILGGLVHAEGTPSGSIDMPPVLILVLIVGVMVFTVVAVAVDHDILPTGTAVTPAEMRSIAEALVKAAKEARKAGSLSDLHIGLV